tara:strand:+ start:17827 stop:18303 length:477 start_codon:yes stop_codon:yes gene_type:complete
MGKIFILLIIVFFVSCSSDKDAPIDDLFALNGLVFNLTEVNVETPLDLNGDGIFSNNLVDEVDCLQTNKLTFLNGTYLREGEIIELYLNDLENYEYRCKSHFSTGQIAIYNNNTTLFMSERLSVSEIQKTTFDYDGNRLIDNREESLPNFMRLIYTKQ